MKKLYSVFLLLFSLYQLPYAEPYVNKRKLNNFNARLSSLVIELEKITTSNKAPKNSKVISLNNYFIRSINEILKHLSSTSKNDEVYTALGTLLELKKNVLSLSKLIKNFHNKKQELLSKEDNSKLQKIKEGIKIDRKKYRFAIISTHNQLCKMNTFKKCSSINIK